MARFFASNVNPDLAKERQTRTFDSEILTRMLDGGEWITNKRRELGKYIAVSLKVPPTHRPVGPCHRPSISVMRSVSDGRWVGVVEGALNRTCVNCRDAAGFWWVG